MSVDMCLKNVKALGSDRILVDIWIQRERVFVAKNVQSDTLFMGETEDFWGMFI